MTLRPYQVDLKNQIYSLIRQKQKSILAVLPTGGGKTIVFADIATGAVKKGNSVMIVCDRKELIAQSVDKLKAFHLFPTVIAPGHRLVKNSVYVASADTLIRREIPDVDIVIFDEAHKTTFDKFIPLFPYAIKLGFTATPHRSGSQNSLSDFYEGMALGPSVKELINFGALVPAKHFSNQIDFSSVSKKGSDYDDKKLLEKFKSTDLYDGMIKNYIQFGQEKKAICFNINVEHSKMSNQLFRDAGISSAHIDGNTPKHERDKIISDHKAGNFFILNNCGVLTTGYDDPSLQVAIINRATLSLPLWLQMTGRVGRPADGSSVLLGDGSKDYSILIDQGANVWRHGRWNDDREWSLEKKKKRGQGNGAGSFKKCKQCEAIIAASARSCEYCGYEYPVSDKELKKAEFGEITDSMYIMKIYKKNVPKFVNRQLGG